VIFREPELSALIEAEAARPEVEHRVELRVLAGPQAGARVVLAHGEYLLGSGDDCSLVLRGPGIAERHALLRFEDGEVGIEPLDGVVCNVQGDEITDAQQLVHGVPFEIGGVWIAVDSEDAPWPDTAADFRKAAQEEQGRAGTAAAEEEAGPATTSDALPPMLSEAGSGKPASNRILASAAAIAVLAFLLVAGWAWWSAREASRQPAAAAAAMVREALPQPPQDVQRILAEFGQDSQLELKRSGREWSVSGYVPSAERKNMLAEQLSSASAEVKLEVWVDAQLLEAARRVLAANAVPGETSLRLESVHAGAATLTGAVSSEARLNAMKSALIAGVPGIRSVESKALLPDALLKLLKERIAGAGLASRLTLLSDTPEVKLNGRLSPEEIGRWESLIVEFSREYGDVLPIRATVTRVVPKPPVGVQTIVGGAMPYIVTDSGQFVNQGGDVQGHTLTAIRDGEVVFEGSRRIKMSR
jgi:type III secretion system YscD/HrpQ family protein